jgi:hypothetical protein
MNPIMQKLLIYASRKLLTLAASRAFELAMPKIYEKLDSSIPTAIFNGAPPDLLKMEMRHAIESATGHPATSTEVQIISALYDPIKNAQRNQRRRR